MLSQRCQHPLTSQGLQPPLKAPLLCSKPSQRHTSRPQTWPICKTSSVQATVTSLPLQQIDASALVDSVLSQIADTDAGVNTTPEEQQRVDSLLEQLESIGASQQPRPLANPLIFGNYNVAYTSQRNSADKGQAAGGRLRGRMGRTLFRTTGLYQSVLQPDIVTNKVAFKVLGLFPGAVSLRGKLEPVGDHGDTVAVNFERPVLSMGSLHLKIGPPSRVVLTTTYLDERVRLGKGSRGSLFVFTRGGASDNAGMDVVGLQESTTGAKIAFTLLFLSLFVGGWTMWATGQPLLRGLAVAMWLLGMAIGSIVRQGGMVNGGRRA